MRANALLIVLLIAGLAGGVACSDDSRPSMNAHGAEPPPGGATALLPFDPQALTAAANAAISGATRRKLGTFVLGAFRRQGQQWRMLAFEASQGLADESLPRVKLVFDGGAWKPAPGERDRFAAFLTDMTEAAKWHEAAVVCGSIKTAADVYLTRYGRDKLDAIDIPFGSDPAVWETVGFGDWNLHYFTPACFKLETSATGFTITCDSSQATLAYGPQSPGTITLNAEVVWRRAGSAAYEAPEPEPLDLTSPQTLDPKAPVDPQAIAQAVRAFLSARLRDPAFRIPLAKRAESQRMLAQACVANLRVNGTQATARLFVSKESAYPLEFAAVQGTWTVATSPQAIVARHDEIAWRPLADALDRIARATVPTPIVRGTSAAKLKAAGIRLRPLALPFAGALEIVQTDNGRWQASFALDRSPRETGPIEAGTLARTNDGWRGVGSASAIADTRNVRFTRKRLDLLLRAIAAYRREHEKLPGTLAAFGPRPEGLSAGDLWPGDATTDGWGRPFSYRVLDASEGFVELESRGADGRPGGTGVASDLAVTNAPRQ